MNILVTGACGFIGSHLVEKLVKRGHNVSAFTFYNARGFNGWIDNLDKRIIKSINIISGDIRDHDFLVNHSKKKDAILHLAALIGIPYSYHAPKSYIDTNVTGTYNVLNASKINNISKTIITSTSEVYGTAKSIPITETHSLNAQSPYAASKIGADQLALSFYRSFKLPVTIIRPFNAFGPRQSTRAIIPTIITQILSKNKNIKLGNLSPTRDFTFVEDTAESFIQALKSKKIDGGGEPKFTDHLTPTIGSSSGAQAPEELDVVSPVNSILLLQEVGENENANQKRQQLIQWGGNILDQLDKIRHDMLLGVIPLERLSSLAQSLRERKANVSDPDLLTLINDIELRAEVEIAKYSRSI